MDDIVSKIYKHIQLWVITHEQKLNLLNLSN
jgi:hypothetical protein